MNMAKLAVKLQQDAAERQKIVAPLQDAMKIMNRRQQIEKEFSDTAEMVRQIGDKTRHLVETSATTQAVFKSLETTHKTLKAMMPNTSFMPLRQEAEKSLARIDKLNAMMRVQERKVPKTQKQRRGDRPRVSLRDRIARAQLNKFRKLNAILMESNRKSGSAARKANKIAEKSLAEAKEANAIAEKSLAETRDANKIAVRANCRATVSALAAIISVFAAVFSQPFVSEFWREILFGG